MLHLIVDGANVVGSRPDGWWHDRAGAARRLANQLVAAVADPELLLAALGQGGATDLYVHLVLEGVAARATDLPTHPRVTVIPAPADGDSTIVELTAELASASDGTPVLVVTADRELRDRVHAGGATTVGPRTLLGALP